MLSRRVVGCFLEGGVGKPPWEIKAVSGLFSLFFFLERRITFEITKKEGVVHFLAMEIQGSGRITLWMLS